MNSIDQITRLHQHRIWVNRRLIGAAGALTADQLRASFPIGQGSVWRTLTHLLAAEFVWLEALLGNESPVMPGDDPDRLPGNQRGRGAIESFDELIQCWDALDQRWREYLASLHESDLDAAISKVSTSSGAGKRYSITRSDVLLHICTHAQYTTAQLINMLRQLGVDDLPDTMLITMAREEVST